MVKFLRKAKKQRRNWHGPDNFLIGALLFLLLLGLLVLASTSYFIGCERFNDCYYHLKHQILVGILPGIICFLIFSQIDYRWLKKISPIIFIGTLALLTAVLIPGLGLGKESAQRWINLFGFPFQPSELIKLSFLIYLAAWLSSKKDLIHNWKQVFLPFLLIVGVIAVLIGLQPDLGTLMVVITTAGAIYFAARASWKQIAILLIIAIILPLIFYVSVPYIRSRVDMFLNPGLDPQGRGYHLKQAMIAIGSGGLLGRGLGYSHQKIAYLPEVISDSIFAVMAEEFGFIFTTLIIALYLFITFRAIQIANKSSDYFGRLLAIGVGWWFIFQAIVNMSAMMRLLPLTGIPLPLISSGGSSMVAYLIAFGILINISRQTK